MFCSGHSDHAPAGGQAAHSLLYPGPGATGRCGVARRPWPALAPGGEGPGRTHGGRLCKGFFGKLPSCDPHGNGHSRPSPIGHPGGIRRPGAAPGRHRPYAGRWLLFDRFHEARFLTGRFPRHRLEHARGIRSNHGQDAPEGDFVPHPAPMAGHR